MLIVSDGEGKVTALALSLAVPQAVVLLGMAAGLSGKHLVLAAKKQWI